MSHLIEWHNLIGDGGLHRMSQVSKYQLVNSYPLTFGMDTDLWSHLKEDLQSAFHALTNQEVHSYQDSKEAVRLYFQNHQLDLGQPVAADDEARALLDTVFEVEEELIQNYQTNVETHRRMGRHIREYLADLLLDFHMAYLKKSLDAGVEGYRALAERIGLSERFNSTKSLQRFAKKVEIYREVGSFIHPAELTLSTVKVKSRSGARAQRGNLWPKDRREKYEFLESLADDLKVCPPYTEADLEFLVSQSSLDMLKKKTNLLLKEIGFIEPNRLKSNYSRLNDHLKRNKQRKTDYEMRRELLLKLGANEQQIDYISARATYQTMKNLLRLANGNLAISDLMGGKRTIRKLLRRSGQSQSEAEEAIAEYLQKEEGISRRVSEAYARTRKNHSLEHLKQTIEFLKENYRQIYKAHWGFNIQETVLRRALEIGLSRQKLSKRSLTQKDYVNDLRHALAAEEAQIVKQQNQMPPEERRQALAPFKEVLEYETDTDTKKQLYFIYELFCDHGLCIPKDKLKKICLQNQRLFPTPRKVQDALEILNGAYRAIGQHGETLCVLPDYLRIPDQGQNGHSPQHSRFY